MEFATDRGVEMVDLKFVDLPGTWQHMSLPLAALDAATSSRDWARRLPIRGFPGDPRVGHCC